MREYKPKKQMLTLLVKLGNKFHNSPDELFLQIEKYLMENPEHHNSYDLIIYLTSKLSILKEVITKSKTNLKEYFEMHTHTCVKALSDGVRMDETSNFDIRFRFNLVDASKCWQHPEEERDLKYQLLFLMASIIGSIKLAKFSLSKVPSNIFALFAFIVAITNNDDNFIKFIKSETNLPFEFVEITVLDILHDSCSKGLINKVKLLLENSNVRNIKHLIDDPDMLFNAAFSGNIELIRYLFDYGFNKVLQMEYAIIAAAHENYLEIIRFLHEKGADIHFNNDEALQIAFKNNNHEIVTYLYQHGSKIDLDSNNFDEPTTG